MSLKDLLKRRVGTLSDWIQEGQGGKKGGSGQSVVTKSETDDDLQSYTSLKSLLDGYGVDTSKLDKNSLDYTYLNGVTDKDGNPLSRAQKREASISLSNYLQDAQALRNKNLVVANAENTARKDTAYQSMLSEKLRKYLGAAEDATGQTGYTGVTQGNRIALANQEAARHQAIQETRDVNVNNALANYINSVNENGRNALEQNTALWASLDAQDDTNYQNYLSEALGFAVDREEEGKITDTDLNDVKAYVDNLEVSTSVKERIKNYLDEYYKSKIITQEEAEQIQEEKEYPQGKGEEVPKSDYKTDAYRQNGQFSSRSAVKIGDSWYQSYQITNPKGKGIDVATTISPDDAKKWNLPNPYSAESPQIMKIEKNQNIYYYMNIGGHYYLLLKNDDYTPSVLKD